jgi:DNA repair protein RadC
MKRIELKVGEPLCNYDQVYGLDDVINLTQGMFDNLPYEKVVVIYLDRQNKPAYVEEPHTIGNKSGSIIDIPRIVTIALNTLSSGVILLHNHPSGNNKPSEQDRKITNELRTALNYFQIQLLDSIVVGTEYTQI